jgi:cytochrome c peroxidase
MATSLACPGARARLVALALLSLGPAVAGGPRAAGAPLSVARTVVSPPAAGASSVRAIPRAYDGRPSVADLSAIGRIAFSDATLSAGGRLACSTCHDPRTAFGPGPHSASPFADGDPAHQGKRAIPSLRYAQFMPRFAEHYFDDEGDDERAVDEGPMGGLTWDGRRDTAHEQARIPLFAPEEMANTDDSALAARVASTAWAGRFRTAFSPPGGNVFDDPKSVVDWLALAFEVFQQEPEFAPFSSKWDRVLAGEATLTAAEKRGYALYEDPAKGNCEICHPSARMARGAAPLFTDAGFIAVAAPRRPGLAPPPAGAVAASVAQVHATHGMAVDGAFDLGLCTSGRRGLADDPSYCGRFRTPSLRNVAVRPSFFHNGSLHSLRDAVAFYATRDTDPGRWYPKNPDGSVRPYDDLPDAFKRYVDHEIPFLPQPDGRPRLDDSEIDDIVAYLKTLTDADVEAASEGEPQAAGPPPR